MFCDVETGKTKRFVKGKCLICNDPNPEFHTTLGASFCGVCWEIMKSGDDDQLGERIVWDD
ncbi:hypothetical protein G9G53_22565 [Paenibacillus sp. EKM206P]|uniref:hypothetical protein n=1 Tax=Paenibacillus sp. EKM206P TaxID=1683674 RepID=UPI0013EA929C|nr:hypothetical protein [Paenibacillus sp. EKM206P]KAF6569075.1 hypothetical protein G9G53_22565 [Paenibacillus sp. EKM206P]